VKQDITDIEWRECPVGSVSTVGPAVFGNGKADDLSSLTSSLNVPLGSDKEGSVVIKKRVRRNEKTKNTTLLHASLSSKLVRKPHKNPVKK
jgi:hypothetical protein